jgi:CubicO group peptidase (beta-lactamase class C family)
MDEMGRENVPGVEVGVYNRGQILLAKGYGPANVELDVPVKPETLSSRARWESNSSRQQ